MKKVFMMLWIIGVIAGGAGLETAFGTPVLTGIKLGTGTHPDAGVTVSPDGNTYTVKGTGNDIWNAADSCEFAYVQVSGNFDISCRLASFVSTNTADGWSKAGIMVRQNINTDGASPMAYMVASLDGDGGPNNGLSWATRMVTVPPATTGTTASFSGMTYSLPVYLRMTRTGNIFNAYYSQDGIEWTRVPGNAAMPGDYDLALTDPVYIGLASCPHREGTTATPPIPPDLATAEFDTIQFNYGASLPTPGYAAREIDYPGPMQLKWDAIPYPEVGGAIKDWTVYFGDGTTEPNFVKLGTVSEPTREYTSPVLDPGKTYYWRVDATNTVNADVAKGIWWTFTTKSTKPYIAPLVNVSVGVNCVATLNATATSGAYSDQGDLTFVWKQTGGTVLKTDGPKAETTSFYSRVLSAENDPNTYWVEVTNKNGTTKSNEVRFLVQQLEFNTIGTTTAGQGMTVTGSNAYTLTGSGADIWGTSDGFAYLSVPASGDGTITARVVNVIGNSGDGDWTKVGVMFRESMAANSMFAAEYVISTANTGGNTFQYRNATGASAASTGDTDRNAPYWVRLVRSGNTFTGFRSADGVTWVQHATTTFTMSSSCYVGLAVTAHNASGLSTGVFDNVSSTWPMIYFSDPQLSPVTPQGWVDPTKVATISWSKSSLAPCSVKYNVYYGTTPSTVTTLLGTTAVDALSLEVPANKFAYNQTIYWMVQPQGGAELTKGPVWTLDTIKLVPVFQTQPPVLTTVKAGDPVSLNVIVVSSTAPYLELTKYEWFQVLNGVTTKVLANGIPVKKWTSESDPTYGQYDCPLALTNFQLANEGEYYCVADNGTTATSNKGRVVIYRMVLHYNFESVTGNTIPDQTQSKVNGTLVPFAAGVIPFAPGGPNGKYELVDSVSGLGKAIRLFGDTDPNGAFIDTGIKPSYFGLTGAAPKSVSIWAKTRTFNNAGLFDMGIYSGNGLSFGIRTLQLEGTNNRWRVQMYGSPDRDVEPVPSSNWSWTHFVLVYNGARSQLYINGQMARDLSGNLLDWAYALDTRDDNTIQIGRYNRDAVQNRFVGLLDDFRLYNYALTAQEAAQLYLDVQGGSSCVIPMRGDLDGDCKVTLEDFALLSAQWMTDTLVRP